MLTPQERLSKSRNRAALAKDQAPSVRQQTKSFVAWQRMSDILGQPFDVTSIPLSKLYQMRRDPMIAFALMYVKVPLVRAPWYIESQSAQVSAFVDAALRQIYGRLVFQICNSMEFGYQCLVKRFELDSPDWRYIDQETGEYKNAWPDEDVKALIWKPFVALPPETVNPRWTKSGDFAGVDYNGANNGMYTFQAWDKKEEEASIDLEHALWITNEKDSVFGSLWGYPRIGYSYRYWWSYWYAWALSDRHYEKDADPPTLVRYPSERLLDEDGLETDSRAIALQLGEDVRSGSTIAMPSKATQDMDGKSTGRYEWDITHVTSGGNFSAFTERFNYLDVMKLRSIWVPENALVEGSGGTSSRNVADAMGDIFYESQAVVMAEIDDHINRFIIPQLVERNFPEHKGEVKKVTRGFSQADEALSKQIVQLVGQSNPKELNVDVRTILEQAGVPLLSPQALQVQQGQIEDQLQNVMPTDTDPKNGNAGVTDGVYIDDRPKVNLSLSDDKVNQYTTAKNVAEALSDDDEEGEFNAAEYSFDHPEAFDYRFADKDIREEASKLYNIWEEAYKDVYESAAKLLAEYNDKISLAEDEEGSSPDDSASKFLQAWVGLAFLKRAVARTRKQQQKIMDLAAKKEFVEAEIKDLQWNATREDAAQWLDEHGAELLKNVSDTVKAEVKDWLSNNFNTGKTPVELSKAFAQQFADYPSWKASRVVRTEVRDAYNAATLLAGKAEGVTHAIASDASGGRNVNTDKHCVDRNGKKFTLANAMKEKDHPNGTLGWKLVPPTTNLSEKSGGGKWRRFLGLNDG